MNKYPNVFSPFRFGNVTVKNRIEVSPMTFMATDGIVTREMIEFYQKQGIWPQELVDLLLDFENHVFEWQGNQEKWKKFEEIKTKYNLS